MKLLPVKESILKRVIKEFALWPHVIIIFLTFLRHSIPTSCQISNFITWYFLILYLTTKKINRKMKTLMVILLEFHSVGKISIFLASFQTPVNNKRNQLKIKGIKVHSLKQSMTSSGSIKTKIYKWRLALATL